MFDIDRDGILNYDEIKSMIDILIFVAKESRNANNYRNTTRNQVINDLLRFTRNNTNQPSNEIENNSLIDVSFYCNLFFYFKINKII